MLLALTWYFPESRPLTPPVIPVCRASFSNSFNWNCFKLITLSFDKIVFFV